jgi:polyhydroxyalkanoate synthesis regulator phasin
MAWSIAMNRLIAALKRIRLSQILMAFLAGVLLFVSTACSSDKVQAQTPNRRQEVPAGLEAVPGKRNPRPEVPEQAETNKFSKGGMNDFSDVDPRLDTSGASQKAKALVDNAEKNVIDETSNVGETTKRILDKKGENVEDLGKNLKESGEFTKDKAQGVAEDVTKGTKQTTEDIKNATRDATRELTRGANQAAENVKENTKAASRDVADKAQQAGDKTSGFAQDKVNQALRGTQRTFYKAGDAAGEAAD